MKGKLMDALSIIGAVVCGAWLVMLIAISGKPGTVIFGAVLGVVAGIIVALLWAAVIARREYKQEQRARRERLAYPASRQFYLVEPNLLAPGQQDGQQKEIRPTN